MRRNNKNEYPLIKEATLIWHYSNGFSKVKGDIRWAFIDLYRTASGEYFLHVSGGPGSDYAAQKNNSSAWGDGFTYTDGEAIIPMSQHELIAWGEENLPDDILRIIFRDIRKKAKQNNKGVPKILELNRQKLTLREKETKMRLTAAKAKEEAQAREARFYEQFAEV